MSPPGDTRSFRACCACERVRIRDVQREVILALVVLVVHPIQALGRAAVATFHLVADGLGTERDPVHANWNACLIKRERPLGLVDDDAVGNDVATDSGDRRTGHGGRARPDDHERRVRPSGRDHESSSETDQWKEHATDTSNRWDAPSL